MLNKIRALAELVGPLRHIQVCADPAHNFLLAMAEAGEAAYLITGNARHILALGRYGITKILTARQAAEMLGYTVERVH